MSAIVNNITKLRGEFVSALKEQQEIQLRMQDVPESQEQDAEPGSENEELAELRADTSLTKQMMSQEAKLQSDRFKQRDVRILKGPRR